MNENQERNIQTMAFALVDTATGVTLGYFNVDKKLENEWYNRYERHLLTLIGAGRVEVDLVGKTEATRYLTLKSRNTVVAWYLPQSDDELLALAAGMDSGEFVIEAFQVDDAKSDLEAAFEGLDLV